MLECLADTSFVSRYKVVYDVDSYEIFPAGDSHFTKANIRSLGKLFDQLRNLKKDSLVYSIEISINSSVSPEGPLKGNIKLSHKRVEVVADFLKGHLDLNGVSIKENAMEDFSIGFFSAFRMGDSQYKDEILKSLEGQGEISSKLRTLKLTEKWNDITSYLDKLRFTDITLSYCKKLTIDVEPLANQNATVLSSSSHSSLIGVPSKENLLPFSPILSQEAFCSKYFVALKNNLLLDVALVANLGLEIGFARHFSIDIPVTFSPYDISSNYKMRTLSFQPEFRYWFKEGWQGHYIGINALVAWYNVITPFNDRTRFQDRNGNTPLWSVGLSYGYSMPLGKKKNWGMEFTVGVGYAHLDYDMFYNVKNGAWFSRETKDYFGITKAGVNIYYRFNGKGGSK